jgi:hypothetical protein
MRTKERLIESQSPGSRNWLTALRTYLGVSVVGHLSWEVIQLPLYTIWSTGTMRELAFAVLHCTGGDIVIALCTLTVALVLVGDPGWPLRRIERVCVLTVGFGVGYAVFSEWLNTDVRASWAYSDWMPTLPWIGTGLSPLLRWVTIPSLALLALQRRLSPSARLFRRRHVRTAR